MAVNYKLIRSVIKDYFKIDKNPKKGLMTLEWVMLGYMAITIITLLFAQLPEQFTLFDASRERGDGASRETIRASCLPMPMRLAWAT